MAKQYRRVEPAEAKSTASNPLALEVALDGALECIALEAWRRTVAAVACVTAAEPSPSINEPAQRSTVSSATAGTGKNGVLSTSEEKLSKEKRRGYEEDSRRVKEGKRRGEYLPSFLVDDYATLEVAEYLSLEEEKGGREGESHTIADVSSAATDLDHSPLGCLMRLVGELAEGEKVSLGHAVAVLNGDGKTLGTLVSAAYFLALLLLLAVMFDLTSV